MKFDVEMLELNRKIMDLRTELCVMEARKEKLIKKHNEEVTKND